MKNYLSSGSIVPVIAAAAVVSGQALLVGALFGFTMTAAAANATVNLKTAGVFTYAKATGAGTAVTQGQKAYWDDANKVFTPTAAGNTLVGVFLVAAGTAVAVATVKLGIVA